jgi:membrane protein
MKTQQPLRSITIVWSFLRNAVFSVPINFIQILFLSVKRFIRDKRLLWAASLTYTTVFSLIPLLSVVFFLFKVFGGFTDLENTVRPFVYKTLAPGAQEKVITTINNLVDSINFSNMGAFGTVVLIISVVLLLGELEYALNEIWVTKQKRPVFYRIAIYWTSLTIGPLLLAASLVIVATLQSSQAVKIIEPYINIDFYAWLPYFLVWTAFTGLYVFLPNTRVRFRSALIGGIIAGTLWHLAGLGFTLYTSKVVFYYPRVFGPLAAIPLFLLWVFISWILFLLGAEIAYHCDHFAFYQSISYSPQISNQDREYLTLRMLFLITRRYLSAQTPPSLRMISASLKIPAHIVEELMAPLLIKGILFASSRYPRCVVLARDPRTVKISDILEIIHCYTVLPDAFYADAVGQFLHQTLGILHPQTPSDIGEKPLADLVAELESTPGQEK